ncbi:MAG TPA: DinB family protein [Kofleriaceae bacterium]|nr:DinB family protein [Kofleriaceae bacterium]
MDALSIVRGFARNNALSNHRLLAACARLSLPDLHATRTSFFPTIMKTLNHILIVDWYYLDALAREGRGRVVFASEEPFAELAPLAAAQRASDRKLIALVEAMRPEDLDSDVALERADHVQHERAGDVLLHLLQHQIHHRGQVHAMLAGTAVAPPQLDEFFLREELPLRQRELDELGLPVT